MIVNIPCKKLPVTRKSFNPRRVIYFDTETKQKDEGSFTYHRMDMAWICYAHYDAEANCTSKYWKYTRSPKLLCEYIHKHAYKKRDLYIVGHNVFFDLQASDFFHYFTLYGYTLDFLYEKGLAYILVIRKDKKVIRCISTTNFFEASLKAMGDLLNLPKLDIDFKESSYQDRKLYCRRDVEITVALFESWLKFIVENNMGKVCLTRAAQAYYSYRKSYMHIPIYPHQDDSLKKFERSCYFGGRVECFEIGRIKNGPFVTVDVNSMYPYIMRSFKCPIRAVSIQDNVRLSMAQAIIKKKCVMAYCDIHTDLPVYPVRHKGKLIFPVGRFSSHMSTKGLSFGLERGFIKGIHKLVVYDADYIFTDFIDHFVGLKTTYTRTKNKIYRDCVKRIVNSLYGKFAQKFADIQQKEQIDFTGYYRLETKNMVTGETEIESKLLNTLLVQSGTIEPAMSFTPISAHITEYARFYLWELIELVGLDKVLYCDTDSIKLRKSDIGPIKHLIHQTNLGALDLEDEYNKLLIIGAKAYITEKEMTIKGVPKKARKHKGYKWSYTQFYNQSTHLRREVTRFFITKKVTKILRTKYDKGKVGKDRRVKPFNFSDLV